ncbi:MAG: GHMP kinase [Rhodospirillaceae bacterium]|nr:GHMP kinase [Rhodospirillaceae bacterium]
MIVSQAARASGSPRARAQAQPVERVTVGVPARLHIGFLDLNGGLGRRFGSLGIAIDAPQTRLRLAHGEGLRAEGPDVRRALGYLRRLVQHFGLEPNLHLVVESAIPAHVGLGSGTQLSLATAIAFCRLNGLEADLRAMARLLDRGARSSIGIASIEQGGVILDGGRGAGDGPPPVVSRLPFPEAWRILLVFDERRRGLHGPAEREAFGRLPPFPAATAARLCRLVLMAALPALAEEDLDGFGAAVAELQRTIGDHFAPVQGGRIMSPAVSEVLGWLEAQGVRGLGQSSWGPTGFAILGSAAEAERFKAEAERRWPAESGLAFAVSRGRNRGAVVEMATRRA